VGRARPAGIRQADLEIAGQGSFAANRQVRPAGNDPEALMSEIEVRVETSDRTLFYASDIRDFLGDHACPTGLSFGRYIPVT
jgi:hypothetical protein